MIDPDEDGKYIVGIMCESRSGYELTNARDRNIVQPSVLRGLGWRVLNVHVLDWLDNSGKVLEYLKHEIEVTVAAKRNGERSEEPEEPKKREITFEKDETAADDSDHVYVPFVPEVIGDQEYFFDNSSTSQIKRIIESAVKWEAPVSKDVLLHYVLTAFAMKKSAKAEARFNEIFDGMGLETTARKESVFAWSFDTDPSSYSDFRGAAEDGSKRRLDDIATEEISAAVVYILAASVSLERAELVKETAKLFGFARTTETAELAVSMGISHAVRSGKARIDQETGRILFNA